MTQPACARQPTGQIRRVTASHSPGFTMPMGRTRRGQPSLPKIHEADLVPRVRRSAASASSRDIFQHAPVPAGSGHSLASLRPRFGSPMERLRL